MLKIRCKNCNVILESHSTKTKCCGCDNLTTVKGETITALDLSLVELITTNQNKKAKTSLFSREDLAFQEERRTRKVRKLEFEIK
jgi:phage FluMu protein Com